MVTEATLEVDNARGMGATMDEAMGGAADCAVGLEAEATSGTDPAGGLEAAGGAEKEDI